MGKFLFFVKKLARERFMRNNVFRIALIGLVLLLAACHARFDSGPYLIVTSDGTRMVRVQTPQKSLKVEYELPGAETNSVTMSEVGTDLHEMPLPETAVRYRVLTNKKKTKWYNLGTAEADRVKRIIAYGDPRVGRSNPVARMYVEKRIGADKPSLVIATGDLVAWGNNEVLWRDLLKGLTPLISRVPYAAAIGNHDESSGNTFKKFFRAGNDENYMSMPLGSGRLILLDSNNIQQRGNEQYAFLEKELAAAQDAWPLIVAFHHPPYNFGHHPPRKDLIAAWVPLFQKYAVDLVILGHDHDYQRIGPIEGVLYIVTGGGGAPLVRVPGHNDPRLKAFVEVNNYVILDIKSDGMTGVVKDDDGDVIDTFSISR